MFTPITQVTVLCVHDLFLNYEERTFVVSPTYGTSPPNNTVEREFIPPWSNSDVFRSRHK